jgi:PQQ-like domain
MRMARAPVSIELPPPPAKAAPAAPRGLQWLDQHGWAEGGGPVFADIDGDGKREILGLAWDRAIASDGLYAVAIDRASLELRWRAGPYPGVWPPASVDLHHLVAIGDRVVVTDARGGVHVLAAATGKVLLERQLRRAVESACNSEDGAPRVFFADDSYWTPSYPGDTGASLFPWEINAGARMLFDPVTGKTGPAPRGLGCQHQPTYCTHYTGAVPAFANRCRDLYETKRIPQGSPAFSPQESWRDGDDRVALGKLESGESAARGWSAKAGERGGVPRWTTSLVSLTWPAMNGSSLSGIGDGAFAHVYTTQHDRLLLSVRDVRTGAPRFWVGLPSGVGSELRSVNVDQGDVFVGVDDDLLVYDAKDGHLRKRLVEL